MSFRGCGSVLPCWEHRRRHRLDPIGQGSLPVTSDKPFRWHAEIDPETLTTLAALDTASVGMTIELEYLVHALFNLDTRLLADAQRGERPGSPEEGRLFYLVLVRALLHALEGESPARAAFVDRLRSSWPSAAVTF